MDPKNKEKHSIDRSDGFGTSRTDPSRREFETSAEEAADAPTETPISQPTITYENSQPSSPPGPDQALQDLENEQPPQAPSLMDDNAMDSQVPTLAMDDNELLPIFGTWRSLLYPTADSKSWRYALAQLPYARWMRKLLYAQDELDATYNAVAAVEFRLRDYPVTLDRKSVDGPTLARRFLGDMLCGPTLPLAWFSTRTRNLVALSPSLTTPTVEPCTATTPTISDTSLPVVSAGSVISVLKQPVRPPGLIEEKQHLEAPIYPYPTTDAKTCTDSQSRTLSQHPDITKSLSLAAARIMTVLPVREIDTRPCSTACVDPIYIKLKCSTLDLTIDAMLDTGASLCCVNRQYVEATSELLKFLENAKRGFSVATANGTIPCRQYLNLEVYAANDTTKTPFTLRFWLFDKLPHKWIFSRCALKLMWSTVRLDMESAIRVNSALAGSFTHRCSPRDEQWRDPIEIPTFQDAHVRTDLKDIIVEPDGTTYGTYGGSHHESRILTMEAAPTEERKAFYDHKQPLCVLPEIMVTKTKDALRFRIDIGPITDPRIKKGLVHILHEYATKLASKSSFDVGTIPNADFPIKLVPEEEIKKRGAKRMHRPYKANRHHKEAIKTTVKELLDAGIIEECNGGSDYAYPVCLAKKKDGKWRMCIDFRHLNMITIRDSFPLPNITTTLQRMQKCRHFSKFDIRCAYYHIPIRRRDLPKSTFVTEDGTYRLKRMAFGLANAPPHFQRIMTRIFGDIAGLVVYIDDMTIASEDEESHLASIHEVLRRCQANNIKLRLDKCELFKKQVEFLGHIVSAQSISIDPEYKRRCLDLLKPTSVAELRRFLGMIGWIGRFIPHLATYTAPMNELKKKNAKWEWTKKCDDAFIALRDAVRKAKILGFPLPNHPFTIECDASNVAVGAVLYQKQDGRKVPIEYLSKTFTDTQLRWTPAERELFAVLYSVSKWHHYISCSHFTVLTDHRNLVNLFNLRGSDVHSRLWRWATKLSEYDFTAKYLPGKDNVVADFLSRNGAKVLCLRRREISELKRQPETMVLTDFYFPLDWRNSLTEALTVATRAQLRAAREASNNANNAASKPPLKAIKPPQQQQRKRGRPRKTSKDTAPAKKAKKSVVRKNAHNKNRRDDTPDSVQEASVKSADTDNTDNTADDDDAETDEAPRRSKRQRKQRKPWSYETGLETHNADEEETAAVQDLPSPPRYYDKKTRNPYDSHVEIAFSALRARSFYSQLMTPTELIREVDRCEWTQKMIRAIQTRDHKKLTPTEKALLRHYRLHSIRIKQRMRTFLYFKGKLVVPESLRRHLLLYFHHHPINAHQGIDRMQRKIGAHYYWPKMNHDIKAICEACMSCQCCKIGHNKKVGPCMQFTVHKPWKLVHVDIVGPLPTTPRGHRMILTMMDRFSSYVVLVPLRTKEASEVALAIVQKWICKYGVFEKLLSDNGTEFANSIADTLSQLFKFEKIWSSIYHPQTNGKLERFHLYLKERIVTQALQNDQSAVDPNNPYPWDDLLPYIAASYNSTPNGMTKFSPHEVIFGTPMQLPDKIMTDILEPVNNDPPNLREFKKEMQRRIKYISDSLKLNQALYDEKRFNRINKNRKADPFRISDIVLRYIGDNVEGNAAKLDVKYDGPWQIIARDNPKSARLRRLAPPFDQVTINIERLKKCPLAALQQPDADEAPTVADSEEKKKEATISNVANNSDNPAVTVIEESSIDLICKAEFPTLLILDTHSTTHLSHEEPHSTTTHEEQHLATAPSLASDLQTSAALVTLDTQPPRLEDAIRSASADTNLSPQEKRLHKIRVVLDYATDHTLQPSKKAIHTPPYVARLMAYQRPKQGSRVLDLMAGNGALAEAVISRAFNRTTSITCVERSEHRLKLGKERLPQCLWLKYDIFSDAFLTEFADKKFDFIISNPEFAVALPTLIICSELLAPNGTLCVLLPSDYFQRRKRHQYIFDNTNLRIIREFKIGRIPYYDDSLNTRRVVDSIFVMTRKTSDYSRARSGYEVAKLPFWFEQEKKKWIPPRLLCILPEYASDEE